MSIDDVPGDPGLVVTGGVRAIGRYAVIGHPVAHSMSPTLHNAWFEKMGVGFTYAALDIPPDELVLRAPALPFEYSGLNITAPLKVAMLGYADRVDETAEVVGATNLLYRDKETKAWTAGNTDGAGFVKGFEEATGEPLAGRDVLILGAGGAARAIAVAVARERASNLFIANRTPENAVKLAQLVGARQALSLSPDVASRCDVIPDLVINTLSTVADPFIETLDLSSLPDQCVLTDINYQHDAALIRRGDEAGLMTVDGRRMFLWQAALSFERWMGESPDLEIGRRLLGL